MVAASTRVKKSRRYRMATALDPPRFLQGKNGSFFDGKKKIFLKCFSFCDEIALSDFAKYIVDALISAQKFLVYIFFDFIDNFSYIIKIEVFCLMKLLFLMLERLFQPVPPINSLIVVLHLQCFTIPPTNCDARHKIRLLTFSIQFLLVPKTRNSDCICYFPTKSYYSNN